MTTPVTLYRNPKSGHCHRVELLLSLGDFGLLQTPRLRLTALRIIC